MIQSELKIVIIIPARLASVRFPRKVLHPFAGLPMVEHVRRRALMCHAVSDVVVATCDAEVAEAVRGFGGKALMTSSSHRNGTDRVAEAVDQVDCTHVVVLQGDEPLILPTQLNVFVEAIRTLPHMQAWNAVVPLGSNADLDDSSIVKCTLSRNDRIMLCWRRSPCISEFAHQREFTYKVQGLIAFERYFLKQLSAMSPTPFEIAEAVEQSRMLEYDFDICGVRLSANVPSVNQPKEAELVENVLSRDPLQKEILSRVLQMNLTKE